MSIDDSKRLMYKSILTELYEDYFNTHEKGKIIAIKELSKDIAWVIAYRNLEALEFLTISFSGSQHYLIKITDLGIEYLKQI